MRQGVVKWFNNEKGFGFIELEANKDVFIHYSNIEMNGYKSLKEGDIVTYELVETEKGLQAHKVCPVKQVETV
jgi:CspA family cold shock protein